jgi:transcriptional regulator GlxA family with amidase domain
LLALPPRTRTGLAKRLLTDTNSPLRAIAAATGYPSARQLSAAFRAIMEREPSEVRRPIAAAVDASAIGLRLD